MDDLLGVPDAVEPADVAAQPEDLPGPGEQGVLDVSGADLTAFDTAVATIVLDRAGRCPVRVGPGQDGAGGGAGERLVALEDQQVVGVQVVGDQAGGLLRGVQPIGG